MVGWLTHTLVVAQRTSLHSLAGAARINLRLNRRSAAVKAEHVPSSSDWIELPYQPIATLWRIRTIVDYMSGKVHVYEEIMSDFTAVDASFSLRPPLSATEKPVALG